jgi:hypothetical protein
MRRIFLLALLIASSQPSCVVVGGYDSSRGWYIWPGSLVILAVAVVLLLLLRRGRR